MFIELREKFSEKLYKAYLKMCNADWDFYTNSTDNNLKKMTKAQDEYSKLFQDKKLYNEFKKIDSSKLNKHEQKQLKNILKDFEEELNSGKELKALRDKENEIAQKFNSYVPRIFGKDISRTEIRTILKNEQNIDIRKEAYYANLKGADLIADDLKDFIKMRNAYAQKKGYKTYFEYKLKEDFEVDLKELQTLLENVYKDSKDVIKKVILKQHKKLQNAFKTEKLKPYHYGFLTKMNPEKRVNNCITDKEQVVEISKTIYSNMGWDVEKLLEDKKLTFDLFPRKGKNTHGFCFDIDAGLDARILANLTNNETSIDTLNHEMGHCVYTLGISRDLTFLDRSTYPAMTEAIAMMMGDLDKREDILKNIVPEKDLERFKNYFKEQEVCFISHSQLLINFEKQMYENPEQDLKKLWHKLKVKYQLRDKREELDNGWALIPHYLSHPAYYQNYFRATLIKAQIYNYLKSKLGNITENNKTAEFLNKNLFSLGTSLEENELIKKLTGKKLSTEDFVSSVK